MKQPVWYQSSCTCGECERWRADNPELKKDGLADALAEWAYLNECPLDSPPVVAAVKLRELREQRDRLLAAIAEQRPYVPTKIQRIAAEISGT